LSDENNELKQKVREMAKLGVLANRISEVQQKNLTYYPFYFFNKVETAKIDYDLSKVNDDGLKNDGEHHVTYHLMLDKEANPKLETRYECISQAVRNLFWTDLKVRVYVNDELAYETKDV
jgi:hypothetical protein